MIKLGHLGSAAALCLLAAGPAESQAPGAPASAAAPTYADLADLALTAPVAAHVRVRRAIPVEAGAAGAVPAGRGRLYMEAELVSLIKGAGGLLSRVTYLADVALDPRGRPLRPKTKSEQLIFARPVPGRPGELQLVAPDAQLAYDPALAERVRNLLREASAPSAPPPITGIGRAFHVPGSLAGESETQFFLQAEGGRPVSITVLRRPGEAPRWAVALSEIVDDAAAAPAADTLLWYRLACTLPPALPATSLAEAEADQVDAIRVDYRLVREGLGACARNRRG